MKDPTGDLYEMMDHAGLNAGNLLASRAPMSKIVNTIRARLAADLKEYIEKRQEEAKTWQEQ